jgi:hypothetical protein
MSTGSCSRGRIRSAVLALAFAALLAGCSDSHLVTGAFRSTEPVVVEGVPGLDDGAWMELVLGQYGPDIAGIIRFRADKDIPIPLEGLCPCRFLIDGRFDAGVLVFAFENPSPCATKATELLAARLTAFDDGDTLIGPVGRTLDDAREWTFIRTIDADDLGSKDKSCDEPDPDEVQGAEG